MKQIVLSTPEAIVNVDNFEFDDHKYYGVLVPNGDKGFITKNKYGRDGFFELVAIQGLTFKNGWGWNGSELKDCVLDILKAKVGGCGNKVFVFDTPRELFLWLAE